MDMIDFLCVRVKELFHEDVVFGAVSKEEVEIWALAL